MRGLLNQFVRKLVARQLVTDDQTEAVLRRDVALIMDGEVTSRTAVREVLRNHGIQIVARYGAARAGAKRILAPDVLSLRERTGRVKAAAGQHDLPAKSI